MRIEVIATGNELLDGSTVDTNSQRLALALKPLGLKINQISLVADDPEKLKKAVKEAYERSDVVVLSGGLGPTEDDLTIETVAKLFKTPLVRSAKAEHNLKRRLKRFKRIAINPSNLKQSFVPKGSSVLLNKMGTAPGIRWNLRKKTLFFVPGVPREYEHILKRHIVPYFGKIRKMGAKSFLFVQKIFGVPESELNEFCKNLKIPAGVSLGFQTHFPENRIKLNVEATSLASAKKKIAPILAKVRKEFKEKVFTEDIDESYEESVVRFLIKKKKKVTLAESCTGGLATSLITRVPGSSKILDQSFVTYSYEAKTKLLDVDSKVLKKYGAVSEQVARQMAENALKLSQAHLSVAITGIAGPGGGLPKKPVGTVWVAWTKKGARKTETKCLHLGQDRHFNQMMSAYFALDRLKKMARI